MKVFIPCMPRSGTSFLTSLVSKMGFNLGPQNWLKPPNIHNPNGYFESLPIMKICFDMLSKLNGDFFYNIPQLYNGWKENLTEEKDKVISLIDEGKIELVKNGPILIVADLFHDIYPDAKWILITRDINETYKSRFGNFISFSDWEKLTKDRLKAWNSTIPSTNALEIDYKDFQMNFNDTCGKISQYLGIDLSEEKLINLRTLFKPSLP